jgi:Bacteriocin-protection, YdeI or OmpD-Associated/Domain of unknown function (DUF1905)
MFGTTSHSKSGFRLRWRLLNWAMLRFRGVIKIRGINPYIHVPAGIARRLKNNWRKPLPVLGRINGQPKNGWRINLMSASDASFYLYLQNTIRKASRTKVGDRISVELSFDKAYRGGLTQAPPLWLSGALRANPTATKSWNTLIPSRKKEILRYFASLKSPEAKARNLKRAIEALSGREIRFMGRTWKGGR